MRVSIRIYTGGIPAFHGDNLVYVRCSISYPEVVFRSYQRIEYLGDL